MSLATLDALTSLEPLLTEEERLVRDTVRRFIRERYLPRSGALYEKEEFPKELIPELASMGLLGASISGYGCAGMGAVTYGLLLQELEYGDSGLRSFVSVQARWPCTRSIRPAPRNKSSAFYRVWPAARRLVASA